MDTGHQEKRDGNVGVVAEQTFTHDWLIPALGIDRHDIDRKSVGCRPFPHVLPLDDLQSG
jgi:hypothetical protein